MANVSGLVHNIRQDAPPEAPASEAQDIYVEESNDNAPHKVVNERGDVIRIEYPDGQVTISLDGSSLEDDENEEESGWFDNLASKIEPNELSRIAEQLLRSIEDDKESRKDWVEQRAAGIKLLGLKIEAPGPGGGTDGAPVEGQSKVRHPLLQEAVLRFQANARSELLPTDGPVKIRNDSNNSTPDQDLLANCLEQDFNHFLTTVASEYYPDTDRMLLLTGFGGCGFKKVYFCPLRNRPVSESVDANDLIVNNMATDLRNARRITHRIIMKPSTVRRLQLMGVYRDIPLDTPKEVELDSAQREERAQQGVTRIVSFDQQDREREIYETFCELDVKGHEHTLNGKETGLEIPYRVTIDVSSRQVLAITRNYDEDDADFPNARSWFVKFPFVPGFGFYDIGLLHILGNTTNAVTAAWRELLDAGMFAAFPGFLYSDAGARQTTTIFRIPPGGGQMIRTGGQPIGDAVMPLPYKEPSPALMSLCENMAETGMRVGGTAEAQVGEGRADAPVGTTLAMIEQAQKVLNAVHKRLHAAQAEEFQLMAQVFREHPESFWQRKKRTAYPWDEATFRKALEDCELIPQADPNTASFGQRLLKVMALKQLAQANPTMYDPLAIDRIAITTLGWSNPEQFFAPPSAQQQPPPELQQQIAETQIKKQLADARTLEAQSKAQETQAKLKGLVPGGEGQGTDPAETDIKRQGLMLKAQAQNFQEQRATIEDKNRDQDREKDVFIAKTRLMAEQMRDEAARQHELLLKQHDSQMDMQKQQNDSQMDMMKHQGGLVAAQQQHEQSLQADLQKHNQQLSASREQQQNSLAADKEKHLREIKSRPKTPPAKPSKPKKGPK